MPDISMCVNSATCPLATLQGKMQDTGTRLDERAMEAKKALPREEALQARAGDIREAISELEEFIGEMRGELRDPAELERLRDLEKEVAALRKEAKPISAAELARLEKQEIGEAFYGDARKAVEIAIGKRSAPEPPNMLEWIAENGGIADVGGNLMHALGRGGKNPKFIKYKTVEKDGKKTRVKHAEYETIIPAAEVQLRKAEGRDTGLSLNDLAQHFREWAPEHFGDEAPTDNEVIGIVSDALNGYLPDWWKGEEFLQMERDADNFRELFRALDVDPKNLREAAEAVRGGDPLILQRLQEKARAAADLPGAEDTLASRRAGRSEVADFIERALTDRRKREAALSREGARAQEAGVAANCQRLSDRATLQEIGENNAD